MALARRESQQYSGGAFASITGKYAGQVVTFAALALPVASSPFVATGRLSCQRASMICQGVVQ